MDEEFRKFINNLYQHFANNKVNEIASDYDCLRVMQATTYKNSRLPNPEEVDKISKNKFFNLLYRELYYRHLFTNIRDKANIEDHSDSFDNYTNIFELLLNTEKPITSSLPNEWLWDLINEFIYQFQIFHSHNDVEEYLKQKPDIWHVRYMIEYLTQLIYKSQINEQLIAYVNQTNQTEAAGTFGRVELYKMLGYFCLVGLCRLYCLLSDYRSAMKAVENINLSQISLYDIVPGCLISLAHCAGFSLMMCMKYYDAIKCFSSTISTIQKHDMNDNVERERMKILSLLTVCLAIFPMNIEQEVDEIVREKFSQHLIEMKKGSLEEIFKVFNQGSIKPIPYYGEEIPFNKTNMKSHAYYTFRQEVMKQCDLMKLRSVLNLYRNIDITKIANTLDVSESKIMSDLMCFKKILSYNSSEFDADLIRDMDFYVEKKTVHVSNTKFDLKYFDYFIKSLQKLEKTNQNLNKLENSTFEHNAVSNHD